MKKVSLFVLLFVLFYLSKARAQTASTTDVSKYYSPLAREKIAGATHPVDNDVDDLPGTKNVPDKVLTMGNRHQSSSGAKDLPGSAPVDTEKINNRNKRFLHQKNG